MWLFFAGDFLDLKTFLTKLFAFKKYRARSGLKLFGTYNTSLDFYRVAPSLPSDL